MIIKSKSYTSDDYTSSANLLKVFKAKEGIRGNKFKSKSKLYIDGNGKLKVDNTKGIDSKIVKKLSPEELDFDYVRLKRLDFRENEQIEYDKMIALKRRVFELRKRILTYATCVPQCRVLNFITITFPANTSDEIAEKIFNSVMTICRKERLINSYFRVSERQQNGTIHFHILVPDYVNIRKLNDHVKTALLYYHKRGHLNCELSVILSYNGVDIAKDRLTKKVVNFKDKTRLKTIKMYITKYITKGNFDSFKRGWSCTRDWSNLFCDIKLKESELYGLLNYQNGLKVKSYQHDYGTTIFTDLTENVHLVYVLSMVNFQLVDYFRVFSDS